MNRVIAFIDFAHERHCEHPPIPGWPWENYPPLILQFGVPYFYTGTVGETAIYYRRTQ